jgi:hypothetical protein
MKRAIFGLAAAMVVSLAPAAAAVEFVFHDFRNLTPFVLNGAAQKLGVYMSYPPRRPLANTSASA